MDHQMTQDEEAVSSILAPSPQSEAVAHDFQELSLQSIQQLPPLKERKNVKALQTRWRSAKHSYNSQLKKERAIRSGSAAKSFTPYVFAKELEFLKPILEMRSTDTCWDIESDAAEPSVSRQEPPNTGSPHTEVDEEAVSVEQEEGRGAAAPVPSCPTTRRGGSTKQSTEKQTDKMLAFLRELSDKFTGQLSITQQFANTLVPYMDQVPSERQLDMQIAVMHCINSFIPSAQPSAQADSIRPMQPPPMATYAPFHNPAAYSQLSMQQTYRPRNPYPYGPPFRQLDPPPAHMTPTHGPPASSFGAPDVPNRGPTYPLHNAPYRGQDEHYGESAPSMSSQQSEASQELFQYHSL